MTDRESPAAKPKPGSLRDRIAAFEQKPADSQPPPPAPRPKPGNVRWEPKVASPPSSPPSASKGGSSEGSVKGRLGGMSAADAKQSIGLGGSLKERMAALQGRGGFGAPAPPPIATEKPKWKPPPVITPSAEDVHEHTSDNASSKDAHDETITSPVDAPAHPIEHQDETEEKDTEGADEAGEDDPEEEEKKRRAAIAARMARLGGARVGMAPVFGYKPTAKKPEEAKKSDEAETHHDSHPTRAESGHEEDQASTKSPEEAPSSAEVKSSKSAESAGLEGLASDKNASQTSITSPGSTHTQSPPLTMPVPAVPRRTGLPRKRSAKPTTPHADVHAASVERADTPKETPKEKLKDEAESLAHDHHTASTADDVPKVEDEEHVRETAKTSAKHDDNEPVVSGEGQDDEANTKEAAHSREEGVEGGAAVDASDLHAEGIEAPSQTVASESEDVAEDDEDEVARRKRIAERIAKSGGYNPLAGGIQLPRRKTSDIRSPERAEAENELLTEETVEQPEEDEETEEPPPPPPRRRSVEVGRERVASQPEVEDQEDEEPPPPPRRDSAEPARRHLPTPPEEDEFEEENEDEDVPPPPPPRGGKDRLSYQSPKHEHEDEDETPPPPPPPRREHTFNREQMSHQTPDVDEEVEEPPPPPPPRRGSKDSSKGSVSPNHPRKRPSNSLPPVPSDGN